MIAEQRLAKPADTPAVAELMRASVLALMATLPGVPLYKAFGFTEVDTAELTMPDGAVLGGVAMERSVDQNGDAR
ncbi:hypothetical protein [Kribbella qitaiheensis]|uniref:hypothetical protein n=1 Tax=Kribbella qitaiheensis TaxID=1544730 RepID=UPI001629D600|nr:hypothetical protein [Kribbella qitaiheensis]